MLGFVSRWGRFSKFIREGLDTLVLGRLVVKWVKGSICWLVGLFLSWGCFVIYFYFNLRVFEYFI